MIALGVILFTIGLCGVMVNRESLLKQVLCIELMVTGALVNMVYFAALKPVDAVTGQAYALVVMAVAALEVALAIAVIVLFYRQNRNISVQDDGGRER